MQRRRSRLSPNLFEFLEPRQLLAVDAIYNLAQANQASSPTAFTEFDGQVIFTASGDYGTQPYITDGTPNGTRLLKNFNADVGGSIPAGYSVWKDRVYFTINRAATGTELWSSDGTASHTTFVADLTPGTTATTTFTAPTPFANRLYFVANSKLWRTDGTTSGTEVVASNVFPEDTVGTIQLPVVNNSLIYSGSASGVGVELLAVNADGSTRVVADVAPGATSSYPTQLVAAGSKMYFDAINTNTGDELFVSDGTTGGTHLVADIRPGSATSSPVVVSAQNGHAYFTAYVDSPSFHRELFYTDGTAVTDLGINASNPAGNQYAETNGKLLFAFTDAVAGKELWVSNGTVSGTGRLLDIAPGSASSNPTSFRMVDGLVYFQAPPGGWWVSDGTVAGTKIDGRDYTPGTPTVLGGGVILSAGSLQTSTEPFVEDPTSGVKTLLADLNTSPQAVTVGTYLRAGPYVYFTVNSTLWRTDGTGPGTISLGLTLGAARVAPDGRLFFASGSNLYATNGTVQGTQLITTFAGGVQTLSLVGNKVVAVVSLPDGTWAAFACDQAASTATLLGNYGSGNISAISGSAGPGLIFFSIRNIQLAQLWQSDGTPGGTTAIDQSADGNRFVTVGATSVAGYYSEFDQFGQPLGLTEIDGSGTRRIVADPSNGNSNSNGGVAFIGDELIFAVDNTLYHYVHGDGAPIAFATIHGPALRDGQNMRAAVVGGTLFFVARDSSNNFALWKTDGTSSGTQMVVSYGGSSPLHLVATSNQLFFDLDNQLYVSDGTAAGTVPVAGVVLDPNQSIRAALDDALILNNPAPKFPLLRIGAASRGSIGGVAFNDTNSNGQLDTGELPIVDRTVYIDMNSNGQCDADEGTQITDGSGQFRFGGLVAGTFAVRQVLPAGAIQTSPPANVTLPAGQVLSGINLGSTMVDHNPPALLRSRQRLDRVPAELEFRFDEDIAAVDSSNLSLKNLAGGTIEIPPSALHIENDWNRLSVDLDGLSLPDGNYQLDAPASAITDVAGNSLPGGLHYGFFVLAGDANHDRVINMQDFVVLAMNFNATGVSADQGDSNGDGKVNALDFNLLASRYGATLPESSTNLLALPAMRTLFSMRPIGEESGLAGILS